MQRSSKRTPCPACGRTKDADCRWSEEVILCHSGADMRPGQVTTIDGADWYLSRHNGGFSGQAAVFKPHKPQDHCTPISRRYRQAVQHINDLHSLQERIHNFDALANAALNIPPLEQMLDSEITEARDTCQQAFDEAKQLVTLLARMKRRDEAYLHPYRAVEAALRQLDYQLTDLNSYCACPRLYWEQHLLRPAAIPTEPEPAVEGDWLFWNAVDPNYRPTDPVVSALHDLHRRCADV